ncbi:MAG: GGDEF domain-containing protein [Candidatus Dormibacteraceae bacterium]
MSRTRLAPAFLAVLSLMLALSVPVSAAPDGSHDHGDGHAPEVARAQDTSQAHDSPQAQDAEHAPDSPHVQDAEHAPVMQHAHGSQHAERSEASRDSEASGTSRAPGAPRDRKEGDGRGSRKATQGAPAPAPAPPSLAVPVAVPNPSLAASGPAPQAAAKAPARPAAVAYSPVVRAPAAPSLAVPRVPAPPALLSPPDLARPHPGRLLPPVAPSLSFPSLSADAATLSLVPAALPAVLGLLMVALSVAVAAGRRRGNRELCTVLGAQLGVSPKALDGVPAGVLRRLSNEVAFDELTGVLRRAAGVAAVEREVERARRSGQPLSVAFVDVDGLKQVNDRLGHAAGDDLLRRVTVALRTRLRGQDLVFRYGGDEFVLLLPATTPVAATRLLKEIRESSAPASAGFSVGVAGMAPGDDARTLIGRADEALYAARGLRR